MLMLLASSEELNFLTGETEQTESGTMSSKRKKKTYEWSARSAEDCLEDLLTLVSAFKTNIVER